MSSQYDLQLVKNYKSLQISLLTLRIGPFWNIFPTFGSSTKFWGFAILVPFFSTSRGYHRAEFCLYPHQIARRVESGTRPSVTRLGSKTLLLVLTLTFTRLLLRPINLQEHRRVSLITLQIFIYLYHLRLKGHFDNLVLILLINQDLLICLLIWISWTGSAGLYHWKQRENR